MNFFVCDIGGTNLRIALVNDKGEILYKRKYFTIKRVKELLETIESEFRSIKKQFKLSAGCISVAGAIMNEDAVWLPNIFGNKTYKLKDKLQKFINFDLYCIDDRTSGLLGEMWKGNAKGYKNVAYLIIGTGVGLGILADGMIIRGSKGVAGSVGWIIMAPLGSSILNSSTVEKFISGPSILKRFRKICGGFIKNVQSIFELYKKTKDKCAETIIKEASIILGKLLSVIANTLNPELIILTGSIGEKWEFFKEESLKIFAKQTSPLAKDVRIEVSELGEDAQIIGCAKYVLNQIKRSDSIVSV